MPPVPSDSVTRYRPASRPGSAVVMSSMYPEPIGTTHRPALDLERAPGNSVDGMQTIELGRTGRQVSRLALGAMQMGNATDESDSVRLLDRYLEVGGSFLDTADCYEWWATRDSRGGESEELLGRWLRHGGRRDRVFLATKGSA